ncbi:hypothetical protein K2X85_20615 [bacterium]|nr:hypothetical protein [bacterium]
MDIEALQKALRDRNELICENHKLIDKTIRQMKIAHSQSKLLVAYILDSRAITIEGSGLFNEFVRNVFVAIKDLNSLEIGFGSDDDAIESIRDRLASEVVGLCDNQAALDRRREDLDDRLVSEMLSYIPEIHRIDDGTAS